MAENLNKKTLFICDLDNTITERQLTSAFKEEGYAVNYIRINKSRYPGGLNTAFVNFENEKDAAKALENLNHLTLGKTELCIVYATNKPTGAPFSYDPKKTVFVKGVPKTIETVILIKIFSSMFGEVSNLRVMRTDTNQSRGYGYITFKNEEDARKAIDHNKDQEMKFEINGSKYVFKFEFSEYTPKENRQENWTDLYIRDYPITWGGDELTKFAEKCGQTKSVISNYKEGLELVYGFSNFVSHADALKFLDLDGKTIYEDTLLPVEGEPEPGRNVFVPYIRKYIPKNIRVSQIQVYKQQGCGIFITDFGPEIKLNDINKEFSKYGTIYSSTLYEKAIHEILPGADSRFPRALVLYDKSDSAQKALSKNGTKSINGKPTQKNIYVDSYRTRGGNSYSRNMQKQNHPVSGGRSQYQGNHPQKSHGINNYSTGNFFENDFRYTSNDVGGADLSAKLEEAVRKCITEKFPNDKAKIPEILGILTQMFSDEEVRTCVSSENHVYDYVVAILTEMGK